MAFNIVVPPCIFSYRCIIQKHIAHKDPTQFRPPTDINLSRQVAEAQMSTANKTHYSNSKAPSCSPAFALATSSSSHASVCRPSTNVITSGFSFKANLSSIILARYTSRASPPIASPLTYLLLALSLSVRVVRLSSLVSS